MSMTGDEPTGLTAQAEARRYTRADLVRVAIETLAMVCRPETCACEAVDPEAVVDGLFDEVET